jgi:hypothetical protein
MSADEEDEAVAADMRARDLLEQQQAESDKMDARVAQILAGVKEVSEASNRIIEKIDHLIELAGKIARAQVKP